MGISIPFQAYKFDIEPEASAWFSKNLTPDYGDGYLKIRDYDIEYMKVTVGSYPESTTDPAKWTHIVFTVGGSGGAALVYRILSMAQGPVLKVMDNLGNNINSGSVELDLELDMLASIYHNSKRPLTTYTDAEVTFTGRWKRLPYPGPVEPYQIRPSQMMVDSAAELPRITDKAYVKRIASDPVTGPFDVVFVKITGMLDVTINSESSKILTNLYFICPLDDVATGPGSSGMYRDASNQYPSLFALINFTSAMTGIPTDGIVDISVSQYCPFELTVGTRSDGATYMTMTGPANWSHTYTNVPWNGSLHSGTTVGYQDNTPIGAYNTASVSLLTVPEWAVGVCQVAIRNVNGEIVHNIDPRYLSWDAVNQVYELTGTYCCYATSSGIVSELELADGSVLQWAEGKLPYTENAWTNYVLTERNYDREMSMIQRDKAQYDLATGAVSSLANGTFTGAFSMGAGAATSGLGMISAAFDYVGNERVRERELNAKENLMKSAPGTAYSDAYGVRYLIRSLMGKHNEVIVMMPSGVSSSEVGDYHDRRGYAVTDYEASVKITDMMNGTEGYISANELTAVSFAGTITDPTYGWANINNVAPYGEYRRILDKQLKQGVYFKVLT